jgi:hypothetical protein
MSMFVGESLISRYSSPVAVALNMDSKNKIKESQQLHVNTCWDATPLPLREGGARH